MADLQLGVIETRFADMIWENEPITSSEIVKLAEESSCDALVDANLRFHNWVGTGDQQVCTICQLSTDGHAHIWQDATCTAPKTCALCPLTEGEPIEHSYDEGVVTTPATCKDEGVKTYTCIHCPATKTESIDKLTTHTYDNVCDTVCNVCSLSRTVEHEYQAAWSKDKTYHWHECAICTNRSEISLHIPGASPTELTPQICTVCGYVIAPALGVQETKPTTQPTQPTTQAPTQPSTQAPTQPPTQPPTEPTTQPTTIPPTEPPTEPTTQPTTEPSTPVTTQPVTYPAPAEPAQDSAVLGITFVELLLIMLSEAAILCGVFLLILRRKR